MHVLETDRLFLREWSDDDTAYFIAMNQDSEVMRYFPALLSPADSMAFVKRIRDHFDEYGYTTYATVRKDTEQFIGFSGLLTVGYEAHFTPATEIGWRLGREHWGQGFATEAAMAVLRLGFERFELPEIVSLTAECNLPSRRVMEKIGMTRDPNEDFDHPKLDPGNPLRRHVLYRSHKS